MMKVKLKTGQVAAVLGIPPKQLQNVVAAGYVQPTVVGHGRGSIRLYSLENIVHLQLLELLVHAYGLERQQAATRLAQVWPKRFSPPALVLVLPPTETVWNAGLPLEPLRLPLRAIAESTQQRITHVMAAYQEKKRGRPAGWKPQMHQALADVSAALQTVSDDQIRHEIAAYRAQQRARPAAVSQS